MGRSLIWVWWIVSRGRMVSRWSGQLWKQDPMLRQIREFRFFSNQWVIQTTKKISLNCLTNKDISCCSDGQTYSVVSYFILSYVLFLSHHWFIRTTYKWPKPLISRLCCKWCINVCINNSHNSCCIICWDISLYFCQYFVLFTDQYVTTKSPTISEISVCWLP